MTNADRIRNMTDEEMAKFLDGYFNCEYYCPVRESRIIDDCYADCPSAILKWLKSEGEEDAENI